MSTLTTDDTRSDAATQPESEALREQAPAAGDGTRSTGGRHRHRHRRTARRTGPLALLAATVRLPLQFLRMLVRHARPSRLPWYGALVLGMLIVAALVVDGLWWQSTRHSRALNAARADALVAATSAAQKVLSWDYRTLPADTARGKAAAAPTGPFLHEYTTTMDSVAKEAGPLKAIAATTVQSGSVVSASSGRVVVLLFADQQAVLQQPGSKTPQTKIAQFRIQLAMVKQHDRWLIDTLKSL